MAARSAPRPVGHRRSAVLLEIGDGVVHRERDQRVEARAWCTARLAGRFHPARHDHELERPEQRESLRRRHRLRDAATQRLLVRRVDAGAHRSGRHALVPVHHRIAGGADTRRGERRGARGLHERAGGQRGGVELQRPHAVDRQLPRGRENLGDPIGPPVIAPVVSDSVEVRVASRHVHLVRAVHEASCGVGRIRQLQHRQKTLPLVGAVTANRKQPGVVGPHRRLADDLPADRA